MSWAYDPWAKAHNKDFERDSSLSDRDQRITWRHAHSIRLSKNKTASVCVIYSHNPGSRQQIHIDGERMKSTGKSQKSSAKSDERKDRKSATGMNGSPKKGGYGGKFTWSGIGLSQAEIEFKREAFDVKDPNFEDPVEISTA